MQSDTHTARPLSPSPVASGLHRPTPSAQVEWPARIPLIQNHFYEKLTPPSSRREAEINLKIHEHCFNDFQLQIDIVDSQLAGIMPENHSPDGFPFANEFTTSNQFNENKIRELRDRRQRLMSSLRFHGNAKTIFWYCVEMM